MILSLKDFVSKRLLNKKSPKRFTIATPQINLNLGQSQLLIYRLPSSRFLGISVVLTGLAAGDSVYVRLYGTYVSPNTFLDKQFESRFSGSDNSDLFQGWTYRDFTEKQNLYIVVENQSPTAVSFTLNLVGESQ